MRETFTVTHDHLKLLKAMWITWEYCEYGAPAVNCKRPYGNSDVEADIAEILGWQYDEDDYDGMPENLRGVAKDLHHEMQTVLQFLVGNLHIYPGTYQLKQEYGNDWEFVGV